MSLSELTVGSLFSGIGGLDLGLERAGMRVVWQSEIDPYASRVLSKHWPAVPNLGDITKIEWAEVPCVDVLCGGYPCQPFSVAGQRGGDADPRHLWPYMFDAIREIRPRFALLENVPGHLSLGFDRVLADLASVGFDAEWSTVSACSVGAPHMRRRLFVVAYPHGSRLEGRWGDEERPGERSAWQGVPADRWKEPDPLAQRVVDGVPSRVDRIRALGNSVVPQVAERVGHMIMEASCVAV